MAAKVSWSVWWNLPISLTLPLARSIIAKPMLSSALLRFSRVYSFRFSTITYRSGYSGNRKGPAHLLVHSVSHLAFPGPNLNRAFVFIGDFEQMEEPRASGWVIMLRDPQFHRLADRINVRTNRSVLWISPQRRGDSFSIIGHAYFKKP